jgi:hypothetical protein
MLVMRFGVLVFSEPVGELLVEVFYTPVQLEQFGRDAGDHRSCDLLGEQRDCVLGRGGDRLVDHGRMSLAHASFARTNSARTCGRLRAALRGFASR